MSGVSDWTERHRPTSESHLEEMKLNAKKYENGSTIGKMVCRRIKQFC